MRTLLTTLAVIAALAMTWAPRQAEACGGFFCGQQPVDQSAERIVFTVNDDGTTTMAVQIMYQGSAPDFAWVLPLGAVPDVESLDVLPLAALTALDANTGPQFQMPDDPECFPPFDDELSAVGGSDPDGGVTVHIRESVGPYDVAVIESEDPEALVEWLRENDFRVTSPMEPYVRVYTEEGMKFLALKLQPEAEVSDIEPFMFTLPGEAPSIPLRLTALAAEPEMGITVFIVGDQRFGPANWDDVTIDDDDIVWNPNTWPMETNWAALVARGVDEVGGEGWVTEMAGPTEPYIELIGRTTPRDEDQARAQEALLGLLEGRPYITRLYTRLAAEEMKSDPLFRRVSGGDVDRAHMLPRYVDGRDMCVFEWDDPEATDATTPCDFAACGAGGLCRVTEVDGADVAGCACIPGTTARTTFDPSGRATVVCQDMRMSFLNPGDRELPGATPLPDTCVGFDCGPGGSCVPINMTPTCVCNEGLVAVGSFNADGGRATRCVTPIAAVPASFYQNRLPELPTALPGGRFVEVADPEIPPMSGGGCSAAGGGGQGAVALLGLVGLVGLLRRRR